MSGCSFIQTMKTLLLAAALLNAPAIADTIKDEALVPPYTLPKALVDADSQPITTPQAWQAARPALLKQFGTHLYGVTPIGKPETLKFVVREEVKNARGGRATRLRVGVLFEGTETGRRMELLVYLPNDVTAKAPVFLGLNFDGNYTTVTDPDLPLPTHYATGLFDNKVPDHKPTEAARGMHAYMWSLDVLLESGCGLATAACGEIEPDAPGRWQEGVRGLTKEPGPGDWGAVGAWAWGLSRAMDYLAANERVDASKVIVIGFSRLGKAAVWAGAQDERFAAVISNASGAGGIALSKRLFGERVADLVTRFPHWFAGNFAAYAGKEETLPLDQHQLAALIAPRPLLATSATADLWSDPKGEFLTLKEASPVYELLGRKGPAADSPPKPGKLINKPLAYFLREGPHDVTLQDWRAMIAFAQKQLCIEPPPVSSTARYARRIAALPADQKSAWEAYLNRSDNQRRRHDETLAAEAKAAGLATPSEPPHGDTFEMDTDDSARPLLTNAAGATLAANLISWQLPCGGWSKAVSYAAPRPPGSAWTSQSEPHHYAGTLDNRSTTEQLLFLAHRFTASPDEKIKASLERGLDYLLEAQFPNGGWPQNYPLEGSYHDSLTLNDEAMLHAIEVLMAASTGNEPWTWLDPERKKQAAAASARGIQALLKLQVFVDGKPTVWAAQYDPLTMQPVSARGYELAALSGSESVSVLRLLFKARPVTPEITAAIDTAMAWFAAHHLADHPDGWSRFYDLTTQKPFFPGKLDGKAWPTEEAMRQSNPGGYDFGVKKPKDLPKYHAKWLKTLAKEQAP
jgi:PelA/Pel-15E family pectate lyase